jgi:hypothetical protein
MLAGVAILRPAFVAPASSPQAFDVFLLRLSRSFSWGSFCEFGSAVPLAIFVATAVSRLHFLRVRAAGATIALTGGILASGMLMLSGLTLWSLTRPGIVTADAAVLTLRTLGFVTGGPGFVAPLGLFIAGVSVTAGLSRLVPRWIMIFGLVVALGCELASLTLVFWYFAWCIPFGRFLSPVWMIALALRLPNRIPAESRSPVSATA